MTRYNIRPVNKDLGWFHTRIYYLFLTFNGIIEESYTDNDLYVNIRHFSVVGKVVVVLRNNAKADLDLA